MSAKIWEDPCWKTADFRSQGSLPKNTLRKSCRKPRNKLSIYSHFNKNPISNNHPMSTRAPSRNWEHVIHPKSSMVKSHHYSSKTAAWKRRFLSLRIKTVCRTAKSSTWKRNYWNIKKLISKIHLKRR
jgi:hypothetical protein